MNKLLLVLSLILVNCAPKESETLPTHPIFKSWSSNGETLDLSQGHWGTFPVSFQSGLVQCDCNMLLSGFEASGQIEVKECKVNNMPNSDCDSLEAQFTYTLSNGVFEICQDSGCTQFY